MRVPVQRVAVMDSVETLLAHPLLSGPNGASTSRVPDITTDALLRCLRELEQR